MFSFLCIVPYQGRGRGVFIRRVVSLFGSDRSGGKEPCLGVVASTKAGLALLVAQVWGEKVVLGDLADGFEERGRPQGKQVQRTFFDVL